MGKFCFQCGVTRFTAEAFRLHGLERHGAGSIPCPFCGCRFEDPTFLLDHHGDYPNGGCVAVSDELCALDHTYIFNIVNLLKRKLSEEAEDEKYSNKEIHVKARHEAPPQPQQLGPVVMNNQPEEGEPKVLQDYPEEMKLVMLSDHSEETEQEK